MGQLPRQHNALYIGIPYPLAQPGYAVLCIQGGQLSLFHCCKKSAGLLTMGVEISRRDGPYSLENVETFRHHSGQVLKLEKAVIKS